MAMAQSSSIEWTEATWNPTTGCDRVSRGCDNCYALTLAKRLKAMGQPRYPRDGDPRASYAVIEKYKIDVKRVEYAIEDTVSVIQASALPEAAKEMLAEVLRTGAAPNGVARTSLPAPARNVPHGGEPPPASQNGDQHAPAEPKKVD